jgi:predicted HD phosphohydrolase
VTAALLHDIGHILTDSDLPDSCAENLDDHHEVRAHGWLEKHFGLAVADPVRLHVAAKRYLCTIDKGYEAKLSPTSRKSFQDQGGQMSDEERSAFESEPYCDEALTLRRWDDLAKDETLTTPLIEAYRDVLTSCLKP